MRTSIGNVGLMGLKEAYPTSEHMKVMLLNI